MLLLTFSRLFYLFYRFCLFRLFPASFFLLYVARARCLGCAFGGGGYADSRGAESPCGRAAGRSAGRPAAVARRESAGGRRWRNAVRGVEIERSRLVWLRWELETRKVRTNPLHCFLARLYGAGTGGSPLAQRGAGVAEGPEARRMGGATPGLGGETRRSPGGHDERREAVRKPFSPRQSPERCGEAGAGRGCGAPLGGRPNHRGRDPTGHAMGGSGPGTQSACGADRAGRLRPLPWSG